MVKTAGGKKTVLIVRISFTGKADSYIDRKANAYERRQFLKKEPGLKEQVQDELSWIDDLEGFLAMTED